MTSRASSPCSRSATTIRHLRLQWYLGGVYPPFSRRITDLGHLPSPTTYRSTGHIIAAANAMIEPAGYQADTRAYSSSETGGGDAVAAVASVRREPL